MYFYAFVATVGLILGSEALGIPWSLLLRAAPFRQLTALGDGGIGLAQALVVLCLFCLAFVALSGVLSAIGSIEGDLYLLQRVSEWPAVWADGRREDLVGGGVRPYAWLLLAAPAVVLVLATYTSVHVLHGRADRIGEHLALTLLAAVAAAQCLHPFRWRLSLLPSCAGLANRIGLATGPRFHRPLPERPDPGMPPAPHPPEHEEWTDHFVLMLTDSTDGAD